MNLKSETLVIIPCRNETATIGELVVKVRALSLPVLVVDDASTDNTADRAKLAGAEVIRFQKCSGKGAALRTGFAHGLGNGFQTAITLDGDGQHRPEEINHFLREFEKSGAEMIIGNRMGEAAQMPWIRRGTNRLMSLILSWKLGQHFPDTQCGFRWIKLTHGFVSKLESANFEIESETLALAMRLNWCVRFLPVSCNYPPARASKIRPFADTLRWLRWLWKTRTEFREQNPFAPAPRPLAAISQKQQVSPQ